MRAALLALASGCALASLALASPALAGGPAILPPEPAPAPPPARAAFDWSGPYVGLGYGRSSGDFDLGPLAFPSLPATPRSLTDGTALSLHAGYLFQRGALVYGAELALSQLSGTTLPGGVDEEVDQIIDLKARAGYAADRILVYGVLGYAQVDWAAPGSDAFSESGPVFGLGLDYAASDRLTIGLEYLARRSSGTFDPPGRDFDLNVDTLSLRVGLRF